MMGSNFKCIILFLTTACFWNIAIVIGDPSRNSCNIETTRATEGDVNTYNMYGDFPGQGNEMNRICAGVEEYVIETQDHFTVDPKKDHQFRDVILNIVKSRTAASENTRDLLRKIFSMFFQYLVETAFRSLGDIACEVSDLTFNVLDVQKPLFYKLCTSVECYHVQSTEEVTDWIRNKYENFDRSLVRVRKSLSPFAVVIISSSNVAEKHVANIFSSLGSQGSVGTRDIVVKILHSAIVKMKALREYIITVTLTLQAAPVDAIFLLNDLAQEIRNNLKGCTVPDGEIVLIRNSVTESIGDFKKISKRIEEILIGLDEMFNSVSSYLQSIFDEISKRV